MSDVSRFSWRQLVVIALTALAAAAGATAVAPPPVCDVGAGEDAGCARGFETRERDGYGSFRWTDGHAGIALAAAGYRGPYVVEVVMAAPRPSDAPRPSVTLSVAGASVAVELSNAPRRYRLLHPPGFSTGDILRITIQSDTWKPPGDRRNLGVLVYRAQAKRLGALALPSVQHTLALLAISLAAALVGRHLARPVAQTAVALAAIGVCGVLWVWLPARTTPFLPLCALLLGGASILFARADRRASHQRRTILREPAWLAAIGGVALDALFVAGMARGAWVAPVVGAQAALAVWGTWSAVGRSWSLVDLLRIALVVRLLALITRLLGGEIGSDPDVELFYSYGRATLELGLPIVEYPSGALIPWALLALPASRELFALALPLCNTAADLLIVWAIWQFTASLETFDAKTQRRNVAQFLCPLRLRAFASAMFQGVHSEKSADVQHRTAMEATSGVAALALFYALSPLLLPFWHGKYDSLPTAFLALGLAAFAQRRMGWSGAALGIGGALKWTPWLAAPALALGLVRQRRVFASVSFPAFAAGGAAAIAAMSLPFAAMNWERFLAPYTLQGGRALTGESLWFLALLIAAPEYWSRLPAPWGAVETGRGFLGIAVAVQGAALAGLILNALRPSLSVSHLIALAALTPAAFLLLNRVFSPQYMMTITAAALIASAAVDAPVRLTRRIILLLSVAQAANLLVWPNTVAWWPLASAVLFAAALGVFGWLIAYALQLPTRFHRYRESADLEHHC